MELATIKLHLNRSTVLTKTNITPAEAVILNTIHQPNEGRITDIAVSDNVKRTSAAEFQRLSERYSAASTVFPGALPTMPDTFADAGFDTIPYVAPATAPPLTRLREYEPDIEPSSDEA